MVSTRSKCIKNVRVWLRLANEAVSEGDLRLARSNVKMADNNIEFHNGHCDKGRCV